MKITLIDAEVTGIILWRRKAHIVRVERSLMIFDTPSWARWIIKRLRGKAAIIAQDGGIRPLAEINQQIREIDRWLVTGKELCKRTYVLYRRQLFHQPVITAETFKLYVHKLLRLKTDITLETSSEFFLNADDNPPTIFVTEEMSVAIWFAGPYVKGKVVGRHEITPRLPDALRTRIRTVQ